VTTDKKLNQHDKMPDPTKTIELKTLNRQAKAFGGWVGTHLRQRGGRTVGRGYHWGHCSKPRAINGDYDTAALAYEACKEVHQQQFKAVKL
jgi:hypothetical protein